MTRFIRLVLLASCALSLVSSFALRQSVALNKSKVPSPVSQVKEKGLETWNLGHVTSQKTSSVPAVREIDVAGLKKLLARDDKPKRPLLVNFWATWCEPCRAEFPDLVKIDGEYRRRGLDFIAVSIDDVAEINTTVPQFLKEMRATMPAYLLNTPEPEAAIAYVDPQWSGSLPATFLYDTQGKIVFKHLGRIKPEELRAAIKTVIRDK